MYQPKVSGIIITGKVPERRRLLDVAVAAWQQQDYPAKHELIVISTDPTFDPQLRGVRFIFAQEQSLGSLRNMGIEVATGDYLVQWDDDDYSHPTRLSWQMSRTLPQSCSIFRWEIHVNAQSPTHAFANNGKSMRCGGFPGTMIWPRGCKARFPDQGKAEDTEFVLALADECGVTVLDNDPMLYVRTFHGANTWSMRHIMQRKPGCRDLLDHEREYLDKVMQQYRG